MYDVSDQLRTWSSSLGDSIDPVEIEAVTSGSSSTTDGSTNRRWGLMVASLVAVALTGVAVVVALGGDDTVRTSPTPIGTDGSGVPATEPVATTDAAPPTDAAIAGPSDTTIEPSIFDLSQLPRSEAFDPAAGGPTLSGPSTVSFAGAPLQDISVSPSGRWIAINRPTGICLLDTTLGTADSDEGCLESSPSVSPSSLVWSPDESQVAFYENLFQFGGDSDIHSVDVASGAIESLTDDGTDDAELGDLDISPFFGADGTLYFFRLGSEPGTSTLFELGDELMPRDGVVLPGLPVGVRADGDGWVVRVALLSEDEPRGAVVRIGPDFSVSDAIELEGLQSLGGFVDVENGRALVRQLRIGGIGRILLDVLRSDSTAFVPEDTETSDRAITGAGLSPDGSSIVLIVEHRTDPSGHQLVVAPILDDGSIGPLGVVATGEEFAPNDGDVTIRPKGLGAQGEIVWTDDKIIYGLGPNEIVTLDITP